MTRISAVMLLLFVTSAARADDAYSYEDIGKIITALCQKASFGFRAEMESTCPLILKRLEPQIAAEKHKAEPKDQK